MTISSELVAIRTKFPDPVPYSSKKYSLHFSLGGMTEEHRPLLCVSYFLIHEGIF
jgi:hypothetical protein